MDHLVKEDTKRDMQLVRNGQRFRVRKDLATNVLTMWKAPLTAGAPCTLPAGTILIADHDQIRTAPGFACVPEAYEELEPVLVPPEDRAHPKYNGYYLVLLADQIGEWLEPLSSSEPS
jgi:hypothetical protein